MRPLTITPLLCVALILGLCGCADQDPSILLTGALTAEADIEEVEGQPPRASCTFEAGGGAQVLLRQDASINLRSLLNRGQPFADGVFGRPPGVWLFVAQVENRLIPNAQGADSLRLDTNVASLKSAEVRFLFANRVVFQRSFSVVVNSSGRGIVQIPIINGSGDITQIETAMLASGVVDNAQIITVTAEITVRGNLLDGTNVESNVLEFPFNFCIDCQEIATTPLCN